MINKMADQLMKLRPQEAALITTIRNIGYGSINIKIHRGLPVMGMEPIQDIDFTEKAKELGFMTANNGERKAV